MTFSNPSTGPGNIKKFKITAAKGGKQIDLSAGVVDYRYYESVLSNNITASAVVIETGNSDKGPEKSSIDGLPIRGGEKVEIEVEDASENNSKIELPNGLFVNRVRDADLNDTSEYYILDLASKEFFLNQQSRVVKRYEGKIGDNVKSILNEVLKTKDNVEVDDTSLGMNFFGNRKKPFYICTWLAARSVPQKAASGGGGGSSTGGTAGFLFFQTRDGLFFRSIDSIFGDEPVKKFIYNDTYGLPEGYDEKVLNYRIGSDIDLNKQQGFGAYNNNSIYFDFYAMEYREVEFDIRKQEGKATTAGPDYINVADEFVDTPTRLYSNIKDIGVNPKGKGDEQLDNWKSDPQRPNYMVEQTQTQAIMRYNQMFTVQTDILIPGDFTIKAGDIVECDFPQLEAKLNKEDNKQSGGKYMVAHVCHRITPSDTLTSLSLVRDSFGKEGGL